MAFKLNRHGVHVYRRTFYYQTYEQAREVKDRLVTDGYTDARVVEYERGHAVQREKSGPYWSEGRSFGTTAWQ